VSRVYAARRRRRGIVLELTRTAIFARIYARRDRVILTRTLAIIVVRGKKTNKTVYSLLVGVAIFAIAVIALKK